MKLFMQNTCIHFKIPSQRFKTDQWIFFFKCFLSILATIKVIESVGTQILLFINLEFKPRITSQAFEPSTLRLQYHSSNPSVNEWILVSVCCIS